MSITNVVVTTPDSAAMVLDQLQPNSTTPLECLNLLVRYVGGLADGAFYFSSVVEQVGAVQASGSLAFSGNPTDSQTCTIANVTFTAKTSGATGNQFNIGSDATHTAINLAAAVNASTSVNGIVSATASSGTVTLTALMAGVVGNAIELSAGTLSNATATAFANGSNGTSATLM